MNRIENGQGSEDDLAQLLGLQIESRAKPFVLWETAAMPVRAFVEN